MALRATEIMIGIWTICRSKRYLPAFNLERMELGYYSDKKLRVENDLFLVFLIDWLFYRALRRPLNEYLAQQAYFNACLKELFQQLLDSAYSSRAIGNA